MNLLRTLQLMMDSVQSFNFIASLGLRLYLAPVFWVAGMNKVNGFEGVVNWFGNKEWGLGLPFPELLAFLATAAEVGGAVLLIFGLGTRWISIPLIFTMLVAITQVHWHNGWQAVHDLQSPWASATAEAALERLHTAKELLQTQGDYTLLTEHGHFVMSNNGVEWAVTYLLMLVALLFLGGGKYVSVDYFIRKHYMKPGSEL